MRRFVLFLFASVAFAAVKVGDVPPEIKLDRLIPGNAALSSLKNKAVVVDFWATWCGPCIAEIPKWNALIEQFQGKNVVFLAITDENPDLIARFLVKYPIKGWVGIGKTREDWELQGVGHKFLIGADGRVGANATGKILTPAAVEDLLAGRPVNLPEPPKYVTQLRSDEPGSAPPTADVIIRPTTVANGRGGTARGQASIAFHAMPIRNILSSLFTIFPDRIVGDAADDPARYDANIALPGATREQFQAFARSVACAGLHITAEKELRDTDVYILSAPNGEPPPE
jgi:thiol-disulfide isomerase/thioredoxin